MDRTHAKYGARQSPHGGSGAGGGSGGSGQFPGGFDDEPIPVDGERNAGPRAVGPPPVKLPNALRPRHEERDEDDEPQPVLVPRVVPPQATGPQPVGPQPVGPQPVAPQPVAGSRIKAFEQRLAGKHEDKGWNRTPNISGTGAIHVRSFHCKLNTEAMEFLDQQINEWLDAHPQYEVKFVTTGVGEWVGKTREPNFVVQVWV